MSHQFSLSWTIEFYFMWHIITYHHNLLQSHQCTLRIWIHSQNNPGYFCHALMMIIKGGLQNKCNPVNRHSIGRYPILAGQSSMNCEQPRWNNNNRIPLSKNKRNMDLETTSEEVSSLTLRTHITGAYYRSFLIFSNRTLTFYFTHIKMKLLEF